MVLPDTMPISAQMLLEAQADDDELRDLLLHPDEHSLDLYEVIFEGINGPIVFDRSKPGKQRPYVPSSLREMVLKGLHNISHPGIRTTTKLITDRYVWPHMKREITDFVRHCQQCQRSKINRHTRTAITHLPVPSERFQTVNVDILSLPNSCGFSYLLMCIDRFSRWPECIPMRDIRTQTVIDAFNLGYVSRFGPPKKLITDRGSQFTSNEWSQLMELLGIHHITTLARKPEQNSMVERFNRTLKDALRTKESPSDWYHHLGLVLLGLRCSIKEDLGYSPSELTYGTSLRLPGQLVNPQPYDNNTNSHTFVNNMRRFFSTIGQTPTNFHCNLNPHVPIDLTTCTHVFLRIDGTRQSLDAVYSGPHKVLKRTPKCFTIETNRGSYDASTDRLIPGRLPLLQRFGQNSPLNSRPIPRQMIPTDTHPPTTVCTNEQDLVRLEDTSVPHGVYPTRVTAPSVTHTPITTNRGRVIRTPRHLQDFVLTPSFEMHL